MDVFSPASAQAPATSELYFRTLFENAPVASVIADRHTRIERVNAAFTALLGYSVAEICGQSVEDITMPEDVAQTRVNTSQVIRDRSVVRYEKRYRHRDGHAVWAVVTVSSIDVGGRRLLLGQILDRSEVRRIAQDLALANERLSKTHAALESSRQYLAALVENVSDTIVVAAPDGTIRFSSESVRAVAGYAPADVVGMSVSRFVHPDDLPRVAQALKLHAEQPNRTLRGDYRMHRKDGNWRDVEVVSRNLVGVPEIVGLVAVIRDVTERRQQERALARANRALKARSQANKALVQATGEAQLYQAMTQAIVEAAGYSMAWIGLPDEAGARLRCVAACGLTVDRVEAVCVSWPEGEDVRDPTARCLRTAEAQVCRTIGPEPCASAAGFQASAAFPLKNAQGLFGVLCIYSDDAGTFDRVEMALLAEMAEDLSFGILTLRVRAERDANLRRLERSMEATVHALAGTVEMRDPYTSGHQRRVADIAAAIGVALGLPEFQLRGLALAARIHDLGKLRVPAEILAKPGQLSAAELALVQCHADAGRQILAGVDFPWPIADIIGQHHERMDGSGYPQGLKGEQILLEARIIAVADTVEAMASHRPYRPAQGIDAALAEIERGRGTLFDAPVVDACLKLFRQKGFHIPA